MIRSDFDTYSHFSHCRGKSIGRVLHYLKPVLGIRYIDYATIGSGVVKLYDKTIADYTWIPLGEEEFNIERPVFDFVCDACREFGIEIGGDYTYDFLHEDYEQELEDLLRRSIKIHNRFIKCNSAANEEKVFGLMVVNQDTKSFLEELKLSVKE